MIDPRPYLRLLRAVAWYLTRDTEESKDLVQDACLTALLYIPPKETEDPKKLLLTIMRNIYFDNLRSRKRWKKIMSDFPLEELRSQIIDLCLPRAEEITYAKEILRFGRRLNTRQQEAIANAAMGHATAGKSGTGGTLTRARRLLTDMTEGIAPAKRGRPRKAAS